MKRFSLQDPLQCPALQNFKDCFCEVRKDQRNEDQRNEDQRNESQFYSTSYLRHIDSFS